MTQPFDFSGKRVLVAGADSDVARGLAEAFADAGAAVEAGEPKAIHRGGCAAFVGDSVAALGGLDVLVIVTEERHREPVEAVSPESWEAGLAGARLAMFCSQQAIPALSASKGAIVTVTSTLGRMAGVPGTSVASAAAGAIEHITRMSALRWGGEGVRVNCLSVGSMADDGAGSRSITDDSVTPLGRVAEVDDILGPALFLASPHARHITGSILVCDGGSYSGH